MPTKEEMAKAYLDQVRQKVVEAERQLEVLRRHLEECEEEFTKKESSE